MKTIIVNQFLGASWVDVYVKDENEKDFLEIEQGLSSSEMYNTIKKFKSEYGIVDGTFNLYNANAEHVKSENLLL